ERRGRGPDVHVVARIPRGVDAARELRAGPRGLDRRRLHRPAGVRRGHRASGRPRPRAPVAHPLVGVGPPPMKPDDENGLRTSSVPGVDTRTLVVLAASATAGVLVEFYDFTIFGFAVATAFPAIFFPNLPPTEALVFSYAAYAAGHPARLLGAFVFGHLGDRVGRKSAFLVNIVAVGGSTCLTGLLPGYATLGVAAPALLVLLRIVQGMGVGGEFGGATSLLAEFAATRRHRAFWMSLANLGLALGLMTASAVFLVLRESFATTGWRIAMLLSALVVIPALVARYKLADSPLFEELKRRDERARLPSLEVLRTHAVPVALLATVSAFQLMDTIVTGTYMVSFMR